MRVCVVGSGGVGGYFGARLAQAGQNVTFVARAEHGSAMLNNGLKVTGISGDFHLSNVKVVENPGQNAPYDLVLVAVKAWQVKDAARTLKGVLTDDGVVLPLQNGVEASDHLADVLGKDQVLMGLCGIVSYIRQPGHIYHAGINPFIQIGECDGSQSKRVHDLVGILNKADGLTATSPDDMRVAMWLKFLFIVAMSGVGSITRAPIGVTRENEDTRSLLEACVREAYHVGCAIGVSLPADAIERTMRMIDASPADATASMQRDIVNGKPSELQNQNEAVKRLGKEAGIDTPINSIICAALAPLEKRARGMLEF